MNCIVCKAPNVFMENFSLSLTTEVTATISAPLCLACIETAPDKLKEAVNSPMLRACLKVAGVSLGMI